MSGAVGDPRLASLHAYAPDVPVALDAAIAHARDVVPSPVLASATDAVVRTLDGEPSTHRTALTDLVEQFVVYVPGVTDAQRTAAASEVERYGVDLRTTVEAIYAVDQLGRQRLVQPQLHPDGAPAGGVGTAPPRPETLDGSLRDLHAAAMRQAEIDPVLTELVRIRCAHHHDCAT